MTYEEYLEKKSAIEYEKNSLIRHLAKDYALNNNPYKIGDTISDSRCTILIEIIDVRYNLDKPSCAYVGTKLKKDGTLYKNGVQYVVHQNNVLKNETK